MEKARKIVVIARPLKLIFVQALVLLLIFHLSGCGVLQLNHSPTASEKIKPFNKIFDHVLFRRQKNFTIPVSARIQIANQLYASDSPGSDSPNEGSIKDELLQTSKKAFQRIFAQVHTTEGSSLDQLFSVAKSNGTEYLFVTKINGFQSERLFQPYDCNTKRMPFVKIGLDEPDFISPIEKEVEFCKWDMNNPIDELSLTLLVYSVPNEHLLDVATLRIKGGFFSWLNSEANLNTLLTEAYPYFLASYTGVE